MPGWSGPGRGTLTGVRVVWALVLVATVIAVAAACVAVGPDHLELSGIGLLIAGPAGAVGLVAIDGLRRRWSRGLAAVGVLAAGVVVVVAGLLHAAIGVGQGVGTLLAVAARSPVDPTPQPALELSILAGLVAAAGCLLALVAGPPRPLARAEVDELPASSRV